MKNIIIVFIAFLFAGLFNPLMAQSSDIDQFTVREIASATQTMSFFVAGNCSMCQSRIEHAAKKIDGVQSATWDKETKELTVSVATNISQQMIEKVIAKSGHDTKTAKAEQVVYEKLPGCCHYERVQ